MKSILPMYRMRRHFDQPQCALFCPVDCIPLDPNHVESQDDLMEKYKKLIAQKSASN